MAGLFIYSLVNCFALDRFCLEMASRRSKSDYFCMVATERNLRTDYEITIVIQDLDNEIKKARTIAKTDKKFQFLIRKILMTTKSCEKYLVVNFIL